jgi:hypothetical protein
MVVLCSLLFALSGCGETKQPDYVQVAVLKGTAYERGFQHGERFADRIRSLYAKLLPNSLLPYLNREQSDIADVLFNYKDNPDDGIESYYETWHNECMASCVDRCTEKCGFSYLLMLDSGHELEKYIPQEYLDEMQGIADGSGVPYEEILILNTFVDTMLTFRSITFFIRQVQAPYIDELEFIGAESDGRDNDDDGETDEEGEGLVTSYQPGPYALFVELPTDVKLRLVLKDRKIGFSKNPDDIKGVDPETIRIQLGEIVYTTADNPDVVVATVIDEEKGDVEVVFTPPDGLPEAASIPFLIQAGDLSKSVITPVHAKFMRDERITVSTTGFGKIPIDVPNRGLDDGRTQPPSISFAVKGDVTPDGRPLHAHHYALLDSDVTHKHTVLFVHVPDEGEPHAVLGYSGIVWGFAGMNTKGVSYSFNNSDSLDNAMVGGVNDDLFDAFLLAKGVPVGIAGRELLRTSKDTADGVSFLSSISHTFGWNFLVNDAAGEAAAVEVDADVFDSGDKGVHVYTSDASKPENLDENSRLFSSTSPDDIRMGSHFAANLEDVSPFTYVLGFEVSAQRVWTSFYFRSLRAYYNLGKAIESMHGKIDVGGAIEILRIPELVDTRDSMIAVVFDPQAHMLHYAMGGVPATDQPFFAFDLEEAVEKGMAP